MSRTQLEISLGILLILATAGMILWYGFNEDERMVAFAKSEQARAIEVGAGLFETYCSRCHGTQGLGIPGLCPPLNDRYFFDQRLQDVSWSGSQEDYIVATVSSGRLISTRPQEYPGQGMPAMPSFSEQYGGPLREDQIRSIAAFIMNWKETAQVVQAAPTPAGPPVGSDITKALPPGDAKAGETLAAALGCTACHVNAQIGPAWLASADQPGMGTRAATRLQQGDYTGKAQTPEQYLFESIVAPNVHLVPGYAAGVMPQGYANSLTDQNMADLIAYLLTLK